MSAITGWAKLADIFWVNPLVPGDNLFFKSN